MKTPVAGKTSSYVIAKVPINTVWGTIPRGSIGVRMEKDYIDFGLEYPIVAWLEEVRDATPLELIATQSS